ncbi:proline-rich receptor-like protein kinase PERK9 [Sus scrofa]|uniref:proline-rich receptor-like protein kinase PERK9 n=1 Tax=Sus scrofa TaxID=9823 RepID=UPI000A2B368D|nr:proline-rich receptor-like protein kinase PERK9 [Sus scrofa]
MGSFRPVACVPRGACGHPGADLADGPPPPQTHAGRPGRLRESSELLIFPLELPPVKESRPSLASAQRGSRAKPTRSRLQDPGERPPRPGDPHLAPSNASPPGPLYSLLPASTFPDPTVTVCWFCFSPPPLALPAARLAQLADSPAVPKLLSILSGTLSGLARFFSHLLRRSPPEAPQRRPDFSLLLPALPVAGLARRPEERPGRLSLLLRVALALPGRPPGRRLPRDEEASAGQSSPVPVSTVVSTTPSAASPGASISSFSPSQTDPLHVRPAGAPVSKQWGRGRMERS